MFSEVHVISVNINQVTVSPYITLPSALPTALFRFQSTFSRRTSGLCLEIFRAINFYVSHRDGDDDDDDDNNNNNIPGNHKVRELQKTAILGTAHILRKVLT